MALSKKKHKRKDRQYQTSVEGVMNKNNLSIFEIQILIYNCLAFSEQERMEAQKSTGIDYAKDMPALLAVTTFFNNQNAEIIAKRLAGKRTVGNILHLEDLVSNADEAVEILQAHLENYSHSFPVITADILKIFFEALLDSDKRSRDPKFSEYDFFWTWIDTVLNLAKEIYVTPVTFLGGHSASDMIMARMFTKEEYVAHINATYGMDIDVHSTTKKLFEELSKTEKSLELGENSTYFRSVLQNSLFGVQQRQKIYFLKKIARLYG